MNERQSRLLAAIIDQFIETALPVGSKRLLESAHFPVSSATIRAEMMALEDEGFLVQPHVSAGRIPTAEGYRMYVREFMQPTKEQRVVMRKFETLKEQYLHRKDQERVYEAVALLAQMIPNVSFATVPHREQVFFMGFSNVLRQPEFEQNATLARFVAEVLETKLAKTLESIEIDEKVRYYIGDEHLLPDLQSCSMMVTSYALRGLTGAIGILGPMRMDYAYNTVALELVADLLRS